MLIFPLLPRARSSPTFLVFSWRHKPMQIRFPPCWCPCEVWNCKQFCALTIKVFKQFTFLMDISQESDLKSQDGISVRSSFGKHFECYVRERYLKKISLVGGHRSSGHNENLSWECLPPIEVSNLLCYLVFTQISSLGFEKFGYVHIDGFWFRCSSRERNRRQNCCGQGEKFAANEWSSFESLQKVSVATIQWENILETVNSETTNWYTRSYNGAFSLSFIGTEHEHELLIHKLLICWATVFAVWHVRRARIQQLVFP